MDGDPHLEVIEIHRAVGGDDSVIRTPASLAAPQILGCTVTGETAIGLAVIQGKIIVI